MLQLAPRLTSHVRHREKYLDVPVPSDRSFVFPNAGALPRTEAASLREFTEAIASRQADQLRNFLQRGDFSKWVADVFSDHALARELHAIEDQFRLGRVNDVTDAIVHAVEARYDFARV